MLFLHPLLCYYAFHCARLCSPPLLLLILFCYALLKFFIIAFFFRYDAGDYVIYAC